MWVCMWVCTKSVRSKWFHYTGLFSSLCDERQAEKQRHHSTEAPSLLCHRCNGKTKGQEMKIKRLFAFLFGFLTSLIKYIWSTLPPAQKLWPPGRFLALVSIHLLSKSYSSTFSHFHVLNCNWNVCRVQTSIFGVFSATLLLQICAVSCSVTEHCEELSPSFTIWLLPAF